MHYRSLTVLAVVLMMFGIVSPVFLAGSSADDSTVAVAGDSDEDYFYITIPGTQAPDQPVDVDLGNGNSATWNVYVVNNSDKYLDVTFNSSTDDSDVKFATTPSGSLLVPQGSTDGKSINEGKVVIEVSDVSGAHKSVTATMVITVTEIGENVSVTKTVTFNVHVKSIYDTSGSYNKFLGIFENTLPAPFDSPWIPFVATILFWIIIAEAACIVIAPRLAKLLDKCTTDDDAKKFEHVIARLIAIFVFFLSLNEGLHILGADAELIAKLTEISMIVYLVLTLVILWKVYLLIVEGILRRFETNEDTSIDMTLMPLFRMIGKLIFWIAGATGILSFFGVDLQGILVSAGVISLGITLGAQNVLSQFFSGIVILMTRPFKKDDFLKINDKVYIVNKVKLMYTEFLSWDKDQIITMPNNVVSSATIVNLTKDDDAYRLYVYFSVAYGSDLKKVERVMLDVAEKSPVVLHDDIHAAPNVRMTDFQDSGIELRLGVTVQDFNGNITAASSLRMDVYQAFVDNDIEIPYNRLEVTMLNDCFKGEKRPGDHVAD